MVPRLLCRLYIEAAFLFKKGCDGVSKGKWNRPARDGWKEFKLVEQPEPWYRVYDIGDNIYAIYEPYQAQEVISYLIMGNEKALLWDTGFYGGNIKNVVDHLWNKEVIVVNSHTHFDHVCGNHLFDKVYMHNSEYAFKQMADGIPKELMLEEYNEEGIATDSPIDIDLNKFEFNPGVYVGVDENTVFDLGGRTLKVIYTKGHSDDSMMLVDEANKLLFTGDTYYPGLIFGQYVTSLVPYYETLYRLAKDYSDYTLIPSHNEPKREGSKLKMLADALKLVSDGKVEAEVLSNGFKIYEVDEFRILTSK